MDPQRHHRPGLEHLTSLNFEDPASVADYLDKRHWIQVGVFAGVCGWWEPGPSVWHSVAMLLVGNGCSVELSPLRYQFTETCGDRYDDNWLVTGGEVATGSERWSFADPALLIDECSLVSAWLRAVAAGTVVATERDADGLLEPGLSFLEPVVAFSVAGHRGRTAVIRVHLSLEAAPPALAGTGGELYQYAVEAEADEIGLRAAADRWDAQCARFPPR
jgi:hypothetical protein